MRESITENYLIQKVRAAGGFTRKVIYQGRTGSPDRWVFLPGGRIIICEIKQLGKKPRPDQQAEIDALKAMGFQVEVVYSKGQVDEILRQVV